MKWGITQVKNLRPIEKLICFSLTVLLPLISCEQQERSQRSLLLIDNLEPSTSDSLEQINPPANITGSYLQCTAIVDTVDGQLINRAGCQVVDKERGAKVAINNMADRIEWGFLRDETSNIGTQIQVQPPEADYHAIYTFQANNGQALDLGSRASRITVALIGVNATDQELTLESHLDNLILEYIDSRILDMYIPVSQ